ncbi:MAG: YbbR-like domain-containing protein [Acetivibrionales bacterium]
MKNWFKKDLNIKIISILIAIVIWLVITNSTNPFISRTIYNVPVSVENEEFLQQNGYTLKNTPRNYIDITIRGRQDAVDKVKAADFEVTLDYAQIKSVHDKKLKISEPVCLVKDVTIESFSPSEVDIQLARNKTGTFPVELKTDIKTKPGYVVLRTSVSPEMMPIYGEESLIDSVDSIKASLELAGVDRDITMNVQCVVYNKEGKEISSLSNDLKVTVTVEVAKELPVYAVTRGRLADDYVETLRVIEPEKVLVTGPPEILEKLTNIKTEQLDIDNIRANFTKSVPLVVPDGVKLVNSPDSVTFNMSVEKLVVRNIELSKSDISILNARNDGTLAYEILTESVQLQFKGRQAEVDAIKPEALKPAVDVMELGEGTHRLPLNIIMPPQLKLMQKASVEVKITKTPETEAPPESNRGEDATQ